MPSISGTHTSTQTHTYAHIYTKGKRGEQSERDGDIK